MDPDKIEMVRSVYTIWDYFGDLGGLNDFLRVVGNILMGLVTALQGSILNNYIIEQLFYHDQKTSSGKVRRVPATFPWGILLLKNKHIHD